MKFFVIAFFLIPILVKAQTRISDIESVEFRQDSLAYMVGTDNFANGKFYGVVTRTSKIAYFPNNPVGISWFLYDYQSRIEGLYIEAFFINGKANGVWVIKTIDQRNNCGYISIRNNYLQGQCVFQCPDSKKKEVEFFDKGLRVGDYVVYNKNGDTLEYYKFINGDIIKIKSYFDAEIFPKYGWCND